MKSTDYDPSIQALLGQCQADWGDPLVNRANLVPYGIKPLDLALYGLDIENGEVDLILGPEKQRKTTLAENILCNYMTSEKPAIKPFTVVDTLESGMPPKRYRDSLISIMATRYLLAQGHKPRELCPVCGTPRCRQLGISPEFLRFNTRTQEQQAAIQGAIEAMMGWPLYVFGANPFQGDTRNLAAAVRGKGARWERLIQEANAKVFIVDHVQQYAFDADTTDYEKQLRAVSAISDVVAQWRVVCLLLSQVSLTSLREARSGNGKIGAAGGQKAAQEANVVLSVNYQPGSGQMKISIEVSRKSATFAIWQNLEDTSGCFYGEARRSSQAMDEKEAL
jgi:hypothetical protein